VVALAVLLGAIGTPSAIASTASAAASPAAVAPDVVIPYAASKPFWSDEFTGAAGARPSPKTWVTEIGNRAQEGWWNNELQYYTAASANSSLDGSGRLVIKALKAAASSKLPCWPSGRCAYTSARITTEGTVSLKYGRADVYAKLPTGRGLLPAIWMLGNSDRVWPAQGEIDIVEVVGHEPRTVYGTAHGPTYFNEAGLGGKATLGSAASKGFHLYSVIKQKNSITWLVDGKAYFTLTPRDLPAKRDWVFEQDMHLLLNVAVGGDWPGDPSSSTAFPAAMTVDYVRLYGEGVVNGIPVTSPK
jgi:beta-glucanase (GH16 family)